MAEGNRLRYQAKTLPERSGTRNRQDRTEIRVRSLWSIATQPAGDNPEPFEAPMKLE